MPITPEDKEALDYAAGALPTHAHLQGVVAQAFRDGRKHERDAADNYQQTAVEKLMPLNRDRHMVVCLVCGGQGLSASSIIHQTSCALVELMIAWGWTKPHTSEEPAYSSAFSGTCRTKMCTAEVGQCDHDS